MLPRECRFRLAGLDQLLGFYDGCDKHLLLYENNQWNENNLIAYMDERPIFEWSMQVDPAIAIIRIFLSLEFDRDEPEWAIL